MMNIQEGGGRVSCGTGMNALQEARASGRHSAAAEEWLLTAQTKFAELTEIRNSMGPLMVNKENILQQQEVAPFCVQKSTQPHHIMTTMATDSVAPPPQCQQKKPTTTTVRGPPIAVRFAASAEEKDILKKLRCNTQKVMEMTGFRGATTSKSSAVQNNNSSTVTPRPANHASHAVPYRSYTPSAPIRRPAVAAPTTPTAQHIHAASKPPTRGPISAMPARKPTRSATPAAVHRTASHSLAVTPNRARTQFAAHPQQQAATSSKPHPQHHHAAAVHHAPSTSEKAVTSHEPQPQRSTASHHQSSAKSIEVYAKSPSVAKPVNGFRRSPPAVFPNSSTKLVFTKDVTATTAPLVAAFSDCTPAINNGGRGRAPSLGSSAEREEASAQPERNAPQPTSPPAIATPAAPQPPPAAVSHTQATFNCSVGCEDDNRKRNPPRNTTLFSE